MTKAANGNKVFWWGVGLAITFVVWSFTTASGLDKRVAVLESSEAHLVTKEDLTPLQVSLEGLSKSVKHNQSLIKRILDKK